MPYILQKDRPRVELGTIVTSGELNYAITKLITEYLKTNGLNYSKINDCIGALDGAKLEFYRRIVIPYENKKIEKNGDVYEDLLSG